MDGNIFMFNAHAARVNLQRSRLHFLEPLGMTHAFDYSDDTRLVRFCTVKFIGDYVDPSPWPIDEHGIPLSVGMRVDERWKGLVDDEAPTMMQLVYAPPEEMFPNVVDDPWRDEPEYRDSVTPESQCPRWRARALDISIWSILAGSVSLLSYASLRVAGLL